MNAFQQEILAGIGNTLPEAKPYDPSINHATKRKDILTDEEKVLALKNALRYFPAELHAALAPSIRTIRNRNPRHSKQKYQRIKSFDTPAENNYAYKLA